MMAVTPPPPHTQSAAACVCVCVSAWLPNKADVAVVFSLVSSFSPTVKLAFHKWNTQSVWSRAHVALNERRRQKRWLRNDSRVETLVTAFWDSTINSLGLETALGGRVRWTGGQVHTSVNKLVCSSSLGSYRGENTEFFNKLNSEQSFFCTYPQEMNLKFSFFHRHKNLELD